LIQALKTDVRIECQLPAEELADRLDVAFDFSLVSGMHDAGRVQKAAVIFRRFGIGAVDDRVVEIGFDDAALEVVQGQWSRVRHPRS
jgi:hypothetical protein